MEAAIMQKYRNTPGVWIDGQWVPLVSGGADEGDESDDNDESGSDDDDSDDDDEPKPKGKTRQFSEDRVENIVKKRVGMAERRARQELAKSLGYSSVDEMKEALAKKSEPSEEEKDLEKERARNAATKAENERQKAEVAQERLDLRVERALLRAGVSPKKADKAVRLIDLKTDDEPDDEDITEAIQKFEEEWPELFGQTGGEEGDDEVPDPKSRVPGSDPGRQPKRKPKGSAEERALARLQGRHPELAKG